MKKQNKFSKFSVLGLFVLLVSIFSLTSCRNDDDKSSEPEYYFSSTEYYGKNADSTVVRQDAVGKWYDVSNNNLLLEVDKSYANPTYPFILVDNIPVPQSYWAYDLTSNIDGYQVPTLAKVQEHYLHQNNINVGGMFHLIVEGNEGWLWVMKNTPYKIRVKKE